MSRRNPYSLHVHTQDVQRKPLQPLVDLLGGGTATVKLAKNKTARTAWDCMAKW